MKNKKIYVTKPFLPELADFVDLLEDIWDRKWLTNNGKYHQIFEERLCDFLGVRYISLFANGTLALLTALQTLRISGEVITTPYSFVATSNVLYWNNIKPVFIDIEDEYCNLNPKRIEEAITPETTAILPVHVYGNPCKVEDIQNIADIYGLRVIYDAAHAFGNKYKSKSILNWGDLSILSFHATKPFNTMEGGAIICHDIETKQRIDFLKNFGFANETTVMAPGINAKMNEMQAALGVLQLDHHHENIKKRKDIAAIYNESLCKLPGISFMPVNHNVTDYNYSYLPIFIDEKKYKKSRDQLYEYLKSKNIYTRRYFYPLISKFSTYRGLSSANDDNLPIANIKSNQVLCLPIYPDLEIDSVSYICNTIKSFRII